MLQIEARRVNYMGIVETQIRVGCQTNCTRTSPKESTTQWRCLQLNLQDQWSVNTTHCPLWVAQLHTLYNTYAVKSSLTFTHACLPFYNNPPVSALPASLLLPTSDNNIPVCCVGVQLNFANPIDPKDVRVLVDSSLHTANHAVTRNSSFLYIAGLQSGTEYPFNITQFDIIGTGESTQQSDLYYTSWCGLTGFYLETFFWGGKMARGKCALGRSPGLPPRKMLVCFYSSTSSHQCWPPPQVIPPLHKWP